MALPVYPAGKMGWNLGRQRLGGAIGGGGDQNFFLGAVQWAGVARGGATGQQQQDRGYSGKSGDHEIMVRFGNPRNDNVWRLTRFPYPALNLASALSVGRPTQARWIS